MMENGAITGGRSPNWKSSLPRNAADILTECEAQHHHKTSKPTRPDGNGWESWVPQSLIRMRQ